MGELRVYHHHIAHALGISEHDLRTVRRVFSADLDQRGGSVSALGRLPAHYSFERTLTFAKEVWPRLAPDAELALLRAARPIEELELMK